MTVRDATQTRARILDAAERLTLERGFAGVSVDRILGESATSKGAFFHHFASKEALGHALIVRWAEGDARILQQTLSRAERISDDPWEQFSFFLGHFVEEAEQAAVAGTDVPGCLFAAYSYQAGLFDAATTDVLAAAMMLWRRRLRAKLDEVFAVRPPVVDLDLDAVADAVTVVFEGAYVVSRSLADPGVVAAQLRLLRSLLRRAFDDRAGAGPGSA